MNSVGNSTHAFLTRSDHSENLYHYTPTRWVCIVFVVLFSISNTIHLAQAFWYRLWWLFPTAIVACVTEIIGWSARLWSSYNPVLRTAFLAQVTTLIMAPTYLIATNFIILGKVIRLLGPQYCRMSPKWYSIVFFICDTTALIIQSVGGAIASGTQPDLGGHIALSGIVLQLVALLFFAFIATEFLLRYIYDRPIRHFNTFRGVLDRNIRLQILGISIMTSVLLIRSIYRTVELAGGWSGKIISTQWLFNAFDGAMIVIAAFTLNFLNPGMLLAGYEDRIQRVDVGAIEKEKATSSPSVGSV
jgi:hypothetical protein